MEYSAQSTVYWFTVNTGSVYHHHTFHSSDILKYHIYTLVPRVFTIRQSNHHLPERSSVILIAG